MEKTSKRKGYLINNVKYLILFILVFLVCYINFSGIVYSTSRTYNSELKTEAETLNFTNLTSSKTVTHSLQPISTTQTYRHGFEVSNLHGIMQIVKDGDMIYGSFSSTYGWNKDLYCYGTGSIDSSDGIEYRSNYIELRLHDDDFDSMDLDERAAIIQDLPRFNFYVNQNKTVEIEINYKLSITSGSGWFDEITDVELRLLLDNGLILDHLLDSYYDSDTNHERYENSQVLMIQADFSNYTGTNMPLEIRLDASKISYEQYIYAYIYSVKITGEFSGNAHLVMWAHDHIGTDLGNEIAHFNTTETTGSLNTFTIAPTTDTNYHYPSVTLVDDYVYDLSSTLFFSGDPNAGSDNNDEADNNADNNDNANDNTFENIPGWPITWFFALIIIGVSCVMIRSYQKFRRT
ncbi:MAG: hypothetical protein ACTSRA_07610 [Promethearchaeota archaeon]